MSLILRARLRLHFTNAPFAYAAVSGVFDTMDAHERFENVYPQLPCSAPLPRLFRERVPRQEVIIFRAEIPTLCLPDTESTSAIVRTVATLSKNLKIT